MELQQTTSLSLLLIQRQYMESDQHSGRKAKKAKTLGYRKYNNNNDIIYIYVPCAQVVDSPQGLAKYLKACSH